MGELSSWLKEEFINLPHLVQQKANKQTLLLIYTIGTN